MLLCIVHARTCTFVHMYMYIHMYNVYIVPSINVLLCIVHARTCTFVHMYIHIIYNIVHIHVHVQECRIKAVLMYKMFIVEAVALYANCPVVRCLLERLWPPSLFA